MGGCIKPNHPRIPPEAMAQIRQIRTVKSTQSQADRYIF